MSEKIAKRLMLTEKSTTYQKFDKLCALADELNIYFEIDCGVMVFHDRDRDSSLPSIFVEDLEDGHHVYTFPPCLEVKLVYDNPAYLKQQKEENESYQKARAEREAAVKAELAAKAKAREEQIKRDTEAMERKQLEALKAKYKDM